LIFTRVILTVDYYPGKIKPMDKRTYTTFVGETVMASGPLEMMLPIVKAQFDRREDTLFLIFDDQSGRQVDFDLRGAMDEVLARALPAKPRPGPGRPKLGVASREISLLPRHWEWLEHQPNGASAALRRLVDQARSLEPDEQRARLAREALGRFMSAMTGNLPGYEEACRALYAADRLRFGNLILPWPRDIRNYIQQRAEEAFRSGDGPRAGEAPAPDKQAACHRE
jgi:uncharacterized protein